MTFLIQIVDGRRDDIEVETSGTRRIYLDKGLELWGLWGWKIEEKEGVFRVESRTCKHPVKDICSNYKVQCG